MHVNFIPCYFAVVAGVGYLVYTKVIKGKKNKKPKDETAVDGWDDDEASETAEVPDEDNKYFEEDDE